MTNGKCNPHVLYFIKRQPRPDYHKAPYHRFIICTLAHTAKWEAGDSTARSCVWTRNAMNDGCGWLWRRWNGFDIDYGHIVKSVTLPNGKRVAFIHPHLHAEPWSLLVNAIWWSLHDLPTWLDERGVRLPTDEFTIGNIRDDSGTCLLSESKRKRLELWREKWNR